MTILKNHPKYFPIFILVGIQLVLLFFIGKLYFNKFLSVTPLNTGVTKNTPTQNYTFFYENEKNITITDKPEWLKNEVKYRHNSDGLNSIREYTLQKNKDTVRIAALGDSFTYGMYMNTKDNWVSSLEKKLNAQECGKKVFEVLNFGVPGYDIEYTLERSRVRAEQYNPDLFIWFIKSDDFSDSKELSAPIEADMLKNNEYTIDLYKRVLDLLFKTHNKEEIIRQQAHQLEEYIAANPKISFLFILPQGSIGYPTLETEQIGKIKNLKKKYPHVDYAFIELGSEHIFSPYDYHFNTSGNLLFSNTLTRLLSNRYCL